MPESFIFGHTSFNRQHQPYFTLQFNDKTDPMPILGEQFSLQFDMSTKYCTGWFDFDQRINMPCPTSSEIEGRYEACVACQRKTGFNPAFYNTTAISQQQEKINQQPHNLYLAYFAPGIIKVGISQKERGIIRLLEQGARLGIILETFGTAIVARSYEAKIAKLFDIKEHVNRKQKQKLLQHAFDESAASEELYRTVQKIEKVLGFKFDHTQLISLQKFYAPAKVDTASMIKPLNNDRFVGSAIAMIGSFCITEHQNQTWLYDLKDFTGHVATKTDIEIELERPVEQLSFF